MASSDADIRVEALLHAAKAITESFFAPGGPKLPIGARDQDSLVKFAKRTGGDLWALPRCDAYNALVLTTRQGDNLLFARPESSGYRGYVSSLNKVLYDMDALAGVSAADVDHVASQSSSKKLGLAYVVLLAIDNTANQSYASVEEGLCDAPRADGLVFPNLLQIMKINNIPLLKATGDTAAGLGIMIGELVAKGLISAGAAEAFYGKGLGDAKRIDGRI